MTGLPLSCLVISDGRRGIENQALGLAEAAGRLRKCDITKQVTESGTAFKAASPRLQFSLKSKPSDYGLTGIPPDFAIGCGRQAIAPLLALKKAAPQCFTAYIQDPKIDPSLFDLVIAPEHDNLSGSNVETMIGSPNRIIKADIASRTIKFSDELNVLPIPRAALLIGGNSKTHKLTPAIHANHMATAKTLIAEGLSLLISTSRRTPAFAQKDWAELAKEHEHIWLYDGSLNDSSGDDSSGPNPYIAFLGGAEFIFVSEDSTNMLTEAASTGKTVFRLPMEGKAGKFQILYDHLKERCHIGPFDGTLTANAYEPLDETTRIAERFWAHYDARTAVMN